MSLLRSLRSERIAAVLLAVAAAAGLVVANSSAGPAIHDLVGQELGWWTLGDWVEDGLLSLFFLVVAIELRHELQNGELRTPARAARPGIAALGGVIVPIVVYLAIVGGSGASAELAGWPIPTATDVAFALGVLAIAGRGLLPQRVRAFLLALAIIDDLIGILTIAVLYGADLDRIPILVAVAIGLALPVRIGHRVRHALEPAVNAIVLPVFAFVACLVVIPTVGARGMEPAFWGVTIALPIGKLVGIVAAGWIADRVLVSDRSQRMPLGDLLAVGALGGIGFTVSLLLASLAFDGQPGLEAQATLGVLAGSAAAVVIAVALVSLQAARYRALARAGGRVRG